MTILSLFHTIYSGMISMTTAGMTTSGALIDLAQCKAATPLGKMIAECGQAYLMLGHTNGTATMPTSHMFTLRFIILFIFEGTD